LVDSISPPFGSVSLASACLFIIFWCDFTYLRTYHQLGTSVSPFGSFLPQFWASRHFGRCSVILYDIHISDVMYPHAFFHGDKAYSIIFSRGRSLFDYFSGTKPIQFFQGTLPIYFILRLASLRTGCLRGPYLSISLELSQPAYRFPTRFFPGDEVYQYILSLAILHTGCLLDSFQGTKSINISDA